MKTEHILKKPLYIFALSLCVLMIVLFIKSEPREAVFALFLAVLVHEAGHIAALFLAGESIKGALFLPFGVLLRARFSCSYLCEALIYLAGPAASIISALAAFLFVKSAPSPSPLSERAARKEAEGLSKHIHQLRVGTLFGSEFKQTILKMMEQLEQCGRWRFSG